MTTYILPVAIVLFLCLFSILAWTFTVYRRFQHAGVQLSQDLQDGATIPLFSQMADSRKSGANVVDDDVKADLAEATAQFGAQGAAAYEDDYPMMVDETPIVRLANTIIQDALKSNASDIHFEPHGNEIEIRHRIDGVLHKAMRMPPYVQIPLTGRYKVMAGIETAARRNQKEGHIGIRYEGIDYDLSVSCLPTRYGEKLVFRIYSANALQGLGRLGLLAHTESQIEKLLTEPTGLVLVAGPHRAGKTTTIYTFLNRLNTVERNIVTVENARTYPLRGTTQVTLEPEMGRALPIVLDMIGTQDADILMLDELQNAETATQALNASASQLTFSTLSARNSVAALTQLLDMGVRPRLLASQLRAVLAQRLVRTICTHCKEYVKVEASTLIPLGFHAEDPNQHVQIAKGKGCEQCQGTGYRGRVGIFELLMVTESLAALLERRASAHEIEAHAHAQGMHPLRTDGLVKVLEGVTTMEEVARVLGMRGLKSE